MNTQSILIIGPDSAPRAELAQRLTRLGALVNHLDADAPRLSGHDDVIYLDARDESLDWSTLEAELTDDLRPLVIVSDGPREIMRSLGGRPGGILVLTGAESDGGFRVAMSLCRALSGSQRPTRGRRRQSTAHRWAPPAPAAPVPVV